MLRAGLGAVTRADMEPGKLGLLRSRVLDLARGPTVLLSPLGTACPDIVPTVRAGKHGVFEFSNVLTGDYAVFAFDSVP